MDRKLTGLNWDDLRVFLSIARAGSIRGAAKDIGKTHATVSRHLQVLQQALNNPLLERRKEGQCLTELGQRIRPLAEQMELSVAEIDRVAFSANTGLAGSVKLSISESLYLSLLYKPIDEFMTNYPMVDLDINTSDAFSNLDWREADVVVRITQNPPELAIGKKVANSPMAVYASAAYLSARPKRDSWLSYHYPPAEEPVIPARVIAKTDSLASVVRMAQMGKGLAMLPCYVGDTDPKLTRLANVEPIPDMQIWVLTHNDLRTNPRIRALMDHLYNAFEKLRPVIEGQLK